MSGMIQIPPIRVSCLYCNGFIWRHTELNFERCRALGYWPLSSRKIRVKFWFPQNSVIPWYLWWPGSPWTPKSTDAQVLYIKWCRTMRTVGFPHPRIPNHRSKIVLLMSGWLNQRMGNPRIWKADYNIILVYVNPHSSNLCCSRFKCIKIHTNRKESLWSLPRQENSVKESFLWMLLSVVTASQGTQAQR